MEHVPASSYDPNLPYVCFRRGYQSNWHKCSFEIDGKSYNCTEQHMMAEKAKLFEDWDARKKILKSKNAREQKKLGREVRGFKESVWKKHSFDIVVKGNIAKYEQNPELKAKLLATGKKVLVEASPNDKIWGVGLHESDPEAHDMKMWQGTNLLGAVLMVVRDHLHEAEDCGSKMNATCTSTNEANAAPASSSSDIKKEIKQGEKPTISAEPKNTSDDETIEAHEAQKGDSAENSEKPGGKKKRWGGGLGRKGANAAKYDVDVMEDG